MMKKALVWIFMLITTPVLASDDSNYPSDATLNQLAYQVAYIEKYLGIVEGKKYTLDNGTTWVDDSNKRTIPIPGRGRLDRLAGQLGYQWFTEGDSDWPDWHKVDDECLPPKCLDTSLGR